MTVLDVFMKALLFWIYNCRRKSSFCPEYIHFKSASFKNGCIPKRNLHIITLIFEGMYINSKKIHKQMDIKILLLNIKVIFNPNLKMFSL